MRIIQIATTISYGDAVGNDVLAMMNEISSMGYDTCIYAENIDSRLRSDKVQPISELDKDEKIDAIIYHLSIGTQLNYTLPEYTGKKLLVYHNITPADYFRDYNEGLYSICVSGRKGAVNLSDKVDYCLADSAYNREELREMGYRCDIDILPILIPFSDYDKAPSEKVLKEYGDDGYTNILFTGRIAPNKKQEDIIRAFYCYQKYYNPRSRLFLVGSWIGLELYYARLKEYVERIGVKNVAFTGHIPFDEILSYYRLADVFLCMSEHEGFCVPLIEAMHFGIPIVAYNSTAIKDTMGRGGILLENKNPLEAAGMINRMVNDEALRVVVAAGQKERLKYFAHGKVSALFKEYLDRFINS